MFKRYQLFLILFFFPIVSNAQDNWSLEKCIKYAWDNNLQIQQQNISIERSRNSLLQSQLSFIPNINASIGENMSWGRSVDMNNLEVIHKFSNSTSASIGASINLLDGLSKYNNIRGGKTDVALSLQEVEKLKNEISISITKAYLQVLLSKQILITSEENFKSIQNQRDRTKKLVDAGSKPYTTLLDIESQLASERVQVVSAENQVNSSLLSLMQLLDLQYNTGFEIDTPNIDYSINQYHFESIDSLYKISLILPTVKVSELSLERSKYDLKLAQGRLYPTISLSVGYGTFFSSNSSGHFFSQFGDNRNPSIGLSMNIPIFNSLQAKTNVKNAKLSVKSKELELKNKHQTLYKEIQSALNDANSYYQKLLASESNLKAQEESFRYVSEKFDIGALNSTDYVVAKTNLFKSQSDYYQAKYQFVFQLKILDFYKGIPITL